MGQCLCTAACEYGALLPASAAENHSECPSGSGARVLGHRVFVQPKEHLTQIHWQGQWSKDDCFWYENISICCVILADFKNITWNNEEGTERLKVCPWKFPKLFSYFWIFFLSGLWLLQSFFQLVRTLQNLQRCCGRCCSCCCFFNGR